MEGLTPQAILQRKKTPDSAKSAAILSLVGLISAGLNQSCNTSTPEERKHSDQTCFFGPEVGTPVFTTEVLPSSAQRNALNIRVCKCEGQFKNTNVDMEVWSYHEPTKVKQVVQKNTGISTRDACTEWVEIPVDKLNHGEWIQPRIISPSGKPYNLCANEEQCKDKSNTLPDNTYLSTSFKYR